MASALPADPPRIGVLLPAGIAAGGEDGLRAGLREVGYIEGKDIAITWSRKAGSVDEAKQQAMELVRSGVRLIVAGGTPAARGALQATSVVPVVYIVGDPVGSGLAANLARPGGNATGLSALTPELTAERLELLRELLPRAKRVAFPADPSNPLHPRYVEETQKAASALGFSIDLRPVRNAGELSQALERLPQLQVDALLVGAGLQFMPNRGQIAAAARKAHLPAIYPAREYLEDGALLAYGFSVRQLLHRSAVYVDRILKGANAGTLPIEQLATFELVVNLREARAIGVSVPESILLRADEVIR
jgi:putative ABC transport system substrate-binding protein